MGSNGEVIFKLILNSATQKKAEELKPLLPKSFRGLAALLFIHLSK